MCEKIFKNPPTIALIHNISKNQIKYLNSEISKFNIGSEIRFILMIYDNPNCSQEDIVNYYGESRSNVAKAVKKLENQHLITRKVDSKNKRKYMLKTTKQGNELAPKIRQISKQWEKEVGILDDKEFNDKLKKIAIKGMKII